MLQFLRNRSTYETLFVVLVTVLFGLAIGMMGALSLKFQIALGVAMLGFMLIMVTPHRRTLCLCLYVMIQPLSIEKILFVDAPIWPGLRGQELIINAGDLVLMLLAAILVTERLITHKPRFVVDKKALLFLTLLVWATISYLIHLLFYQSNFMSNAPLGLLHLTRNFLFVVIIGSAIKTRSDVIWILLAVLFMLGFESVLVSLSFATHKTYTFMSLIGGTQFIQSYSGTSGNIVRAVGTLGVANQQGLFHAMFTFLVIGFICCAQSNCAIQRIGSHTHEFYCGYFYLLSWIMAMYRFSQHVNCVYFCQTRRSCTKGLVNWWCGHDCFFLWH